MASLLCHLIPVTPTISALLTRCWKSPYSAGGNPEMGESGTYLPNSAEPRALDTAHLLPGLLPHLYQEAGLDMFHQHILCFLKCPSPGAWATPGELSGWAAWVPKELGHMLQPCTVHPLMQDTLCAPSQASNDCLWLDAIAGVQPPSSTSGSWLTPCSEVLVMHCHSF